MSLRIQSYCKGNLRQLAESFKKNTPKYFGEHEWEDCHRYLEKYGETYFVLTEDGVAQGGGGYHRTGAGAVRLSWFFLNPERQGQGDGRRLVEFCLEQINETIQPSRLEVWTSQYAQRFFEKFGFRTQAIRENYWAEGIHLYRMEKLSE